MGRKTQATTTAEKLNEATADAARILADSLATYGSMLQEMVRFAKETEDYNQSVRHLELAQRLIKPMARLSEAMAHVKGERRQTIAVERAPNCTAIAPQSAPNNPLSAEEKAALSVEKSPPEAAPPGGEGGEDGFIPPPV